MKYELRLTVETEWIKPRSRRLADVFDVHYSRLEIMEMLRDAESVCGDVVPVEDDISEMPWASKKNLTAYMDRLEATPVE